LACPLSPPIVPSTVGIHAWTAGVIGLMTVAVMLGRELINEMSRASASPIARWFK
jgi:hypothetical protein